jgi:hypothetical protein
MKSFSSTNTDSVMLNDRRLQFYAFLLSFIRNQTKHDRYWQKNNFLLFSKCLKMYSFFAFAFKVCKKCFKGTVPRDFRLLVFFMNPFPPSPLSIPLGPFQIFSKIRGDTFVARR